MDVELLVSQSVVNLGCIILSEFILFTEELK